MVLFGGACVVAPGGACVVAPGGGGVRGFFDEIRSMSGRYASYWNAFLFLYVVCILLILFSSELLFCCLVKQFFMQEN